MQLVLVIVGIMSMMRVMILVTRIATLVKTTYCIISEVTAIS